MYLTTRLTARLSLCAAPSPRARGTVLVNNNEDFRVETACLSRLDEERRRKGLKGSLRVAMVTGGADSTLTVLLHPAVGHVLSFDTNPLQIHLLHLKLAVAVSELSGEEARSFLLRGGGDRGGDGRRIFDSTLARHLPKDTLDFFSPAGAGADEIELGILRADNDGRECRVRDSESITIRGRHKARNEGTNTHDGIQRER